MPNKRTRRELLRDGALIATGVAVAGTARAAAQEAPAGGRKVRVALLSMAHVHAAGYAQELARDRERAQITCVWDDDPDRGRPFAERYRVPFTQNLEEALSRDDVDAVCINAETSKHHDIMLAAATRKKHIFTEKALTITTKDADEVVRAVRSAGIKFMISLPSRTDPEVLFCKQVLDRGAIGQVTLMRARIAHSAALDGWFQGGSAWFGNQKLAGGGALFDLGCHTVDVMRWFLGQPARVMAIVDNVSGRYPIDDNSAAVVEFKNKALGMLDVSWVHRDGPNMWEIYGTEGYILRGAPGQGLQFHSTKPASELAGLDPANLPPRLPSPMSQWLSAILRDEPTTITVEDGRNLTQMLEAIYTSSRSNKAVLF